MIVQTRCQCGRAFEHSYEAHEEFRDHYGTQKISIEEFLSCVITRVEVGKGLLSEQNC